MLNTSSLFSFGGSAKEQCVHHNEKASFKGYIVFTIIGVIISSVLIFLNNKYGRVDLRERISIEVLEMQLAIITGMIGIAITTAIILIRRSHLNRYALGIKMNHEDEIELSKLLKDKLCTALSSNEQAELEILQHKLELGMLKIKELKKLKKIIL